MSYITVDIDIDDILWNLSDREKQKLVDKLYEDGFFPEEIEKKQNLSASNDDFEESLDKLRGKCHLLTLKEEQTINNIAKRF
jgi:hypothetical protein